MLYLIIIVLVVILIYVISGSSSYEINGNFASRYNLLINDILKNQLSRVIKDDYYRCVIETKEPMINGKSTFTLTDHEEYVEIICLINSDITYLDKSKLRLEFSKLTCKEYPSYVIQDIKDGIQFMIDDKLKKHSQDLVNDFYDEITNIVDP